MIPAQLLGNMWAQEWGNVYDIVAPPATPATYDIGDILKERKATARQVTEYGENFFHSLGFDKLPDTFWQRSMLTRPADRDVVLPCQRLGYRFRSGRAPQSLPA